MDKCSVFLRVIHKNVNIKIHYIILPVLLYSYVFETWSVMLGRTRGFRLGFEEDNWT